MKNFLMLAAGFAVVAATGCATQKDKKVSGQSATGIPQPIVTPAVSFTAAVVSVNDNGRFVVLGFPGGDLPKPPQTMSLYRAGLKVGLVKISGPQSENNIVADIVSGEAKIGDTVREQ